MRVVSAVGLTLLIAPALAHAQNDVARRQAVEVAARVPFEKAVTGAPYSGEIVIEASQTLADGNHINKKSGGKVYRDSQGRVRREDEATFTAMTANGPTTVRRATIAIVDPVGGFSYSLDPERKLAWRTPIGGALPGSLDLIKQKLEVEQTAARARERAAQSNDAPSKASAEAATRARSGGSGEPVGAGGYMVSPTMRGGRGTMLEENRAPLEHKTIDGLAVEGRKNTETIPAGQIGNELPITITSEEWTSTDLKVLVMTKHSDPRTGESSYRLTNVVRAEPDPSLFLVPSDYEIRDTGIKKLDQVRVEQQKLEQALRQKKD